MPTLNPRVSVVLTPQQLATLKKSSALQGKSVSKLIQELVELAEPSLSLVNQTIERTNEIQATEFQNLKHSLCSAEAKLGGPIREILTVIEQFGQSNPRYVIRGSK